MVYICSLPKWGDRFGKQEKKKSSQGVEHESHRHESDRKLDRIGPSRTLKLLESETRKPQTITMTTLLKWIIGGSEDTESSQP